MRINQSWDDRLQVRQLQIVGADQSEAVSLRQGCNVGLAADEPLPVVGAFENLVDQKQYGWRGRLPSRIQDRFESFDFSVEKRQTGIERIIDADATGQPAPCPLE